MNRVSKDKGGVGEETGANQGVPKKQACVEKAGFYSECSEMLLKF